MRTIAFLVLSMISARIACAQSTAQDTVLIDTDSSFDVNYVKFDLSVRPDTEYIAGSVEFRAHANALRPDRTIQLSLRGQLSVDSLFNDGTPATFNHFGDKLFVTLNHSYSPSAPFDLVIYYHGFSTSPDRVGFIHTWQNWDPATGIPISWSWGEPFGMKDWWPCKDNPADKLDSADLYFTCDKPYMIGSNGTLVGVADHDTSQTFHWHESYPIDHYLLAFVCTQFDTLTHWHRWADGDSTKIMHFVFPGSVDTMGPELGLVDSILNLYEGWFGPYAFRKEKYGIAQWHGGGMENETLSFCNDADSGLVAHETAHQWFGDAITCKTWNDCWLNEGFATYVADLFMRQNHGVPYFNDVISSREQNVTSQPDGTVHTPDSLLLTDVLNDRLVYDKGALLLHMLNFVLGSDSAFFRCLREYVTGPLRYGVAGAEDFRTSVEKSSGRDLKWFFDEWVYGDGYPIYDVAWNAQDSLHPSVAISQTGSTPNSPLFTMPIELEFIGSDIDTTVQVWDDAPLKPFGFTFSNPVTRLVFDPHNWLLDGSLPRTLAVHSAISSSPSEFRITKLLNSYSADFSVDKSGPVSIEIYDLLGRQIAMIPLGIQEAGSHSIPWRTETPLSPGAYFCRLISERSNDEIAKFMVGN
ncbi:MAG TPA: M1 family aminopeptidase [Candidatus Kapabacteria bacterium]|nr:M1 family aminopeptidase [Candidatus Kapabacteria bacterium]